MIEIRTEGSSAIVVDLAEYPGRVTKAMVRALNRSITSARAAMVKEMAKDTGVKSGDLRDAFRMRNATANNPEASIGASLKRLPLIDFKATGPYPSLGKGRGVSYKLPTGRSRIADAFFAQVTGSGGGTHRGVFRRVGKARLPIKELYGPSLGHVFAKFKAIGLAKAEESFRTNFAHELDYASGQGSSDVS